ncbi:MULTISPECIES: M50 family metallopeptidase [Microbacterium]|uniref:M50 family metallopeptidase n=1 Tax=Microbacterium TaxID=33882 RepID=UPI000D642DBC|nr:M50 family metallopeptidase [Microbacterium sp. KCTC 39802]
MEILAFVIGVALMVVGLAVSIALHELGHLWPAKKFGVRVGQYMVGFGPTLWSKRWRGTEYGVKAIPLGGYISMAGMYPPSPARRRAGERVESQQSDGRAGRAGGGFFATMVQDARDANDETVHGADDTHVFYRLPIWQRIVVMLGGPVMNLLFAVVLFTILLSGIGVQTATTEVARLSECVPSSTSSECTDSSATAPAEAAGIQPGDVIVSIDGQPVADFDEATAIIRSSPGRQLTVVIERDGAEQTLQITPATIEAEVTAADGTTTTEEVGFVGIGPTVEYVQQPIWAGAQMTGQNVQAVVGIIWQLPVKVWQTGVDLVTGQERDPNGPLSIVGASRLSGEVAAADSPILNRVAGFLSLLASLNIALFVFNMIPLLPLDGGHIAVALWEGIKRVWAKVFRRPPPKPVDATKLVPLTFAVFVALLVMGGILILADLFNPVSLI